MPETIYEIADRFRREILQQERAAVNELIRYYGDMWQVVRGEIEKAMRLWDEGSFFHAMRLQALQVQIEGLLAGFADLAYKNIGQSRQAAIQAALGHTAYFGQWGLAQMGVRVAWNGVPVEAINQLIGTAQKGSALYDLLVSYGAGKDKQIIGKIAQGMALGLNPRMIAADIKKLMGDDLTRALKLARTEVIRSYREATRISYQANRDIINGYMRRSARNERTCAACWALDGTAYSLDEPLADHPNGRCFIVPKFREDLWFDADAARRNGLRLDDTGEKAFRQLAAGKQREILGWGKYQAWSHGAISLKDLVGYDNDERWGKSIHERSLAEILGKDEAEKWKKYVEPDTTQAIGTPVSNAFDHINEEVKSSFQYALKMIGQVHGDGQLPKIPVFCHKKGKYYGAYDPDSLFIEIWNNGDHKELTACHEIGHFLDHKGINPTSMLTSGEGGKLFEDWRKAIFSSNAYKSLTALEPQVVDTPKGKVYVTANLISYYQKYDECFARSYAQYIAWKTQDVLLLEQLNGLRTDPYYQIYTTQWDDNDFLPIAEAIEKMFIELGWQ